MKTDLSQEDLDTLNRFQCEPTEEEMQAQIDAILAANKCLKNIDDETKRMIDLAT